MKIKIQPDLEKARAIERIIKGRKDFIKTLNGKGFATTVICENYYEVIKELATGLFLSKGIKFIGEYAHKELIQEMAELIGLDDSIIVFLEDFRKRRNGSLYYGEPFEETYLKNHKNTIDSIIKKIEVFLDKEKFAKIPKLL